MEKHKRETPELQIGVSNWENKSVFTGDNLPIMRGMNSESVDLIYLDPPFNSNSNYAAPIGSEAAGAEFKDTWTLNDLDIAWLDLIETRHSALNRVIQAAMTKSDKSYLIYMAVRLLEMKRILKDSGSIYLHCDPTMSHYLKLVMDAVFGRLAYQSEVVWGYRTQGVSMSRWPRKHDILLHYGGGGEITFNPQKERLIYSRPFRHTQQDSDGNYYVDVYVRDVWDDKETKALISQSKERTGYPTQKPLGLLERVIKASSNEDNVVFDPFCGCATTLVAADRLHRQWIGIDISSKAIELVEYRIKKDQGIFENIIARNDIPQRTDIEVLRLYNSPDNKKHLYGQQTGNCNGCSQHFETQHLEVDHIIARSMGGTDHIENLQLLCGHCNKVKGNRGQEYLIAKLEGRKVAYA